MTSQRYRRVLFGLLGLCVAAGAVADDLQGRVVAVADGDTLTILTAQHEQVKVRLAEIDAPEKAQPFSARARQSLVDMCHGVDATAKVQTKDRYGRSVARVLCGGVDANLEQVRRGFAWVYDRYVTDRSLYPEQDAARAAGRGLWRDPEPQAPWDFRKAKREKV